MFVVPMALELRLADFPFTIYGFIIPQNLWILNMAGLVYELGKGYIRAEIDCKKIHVFQEKVYLTISSLT